MSRFGIKTLEDSGFCLKFCVLFVKVPYLYTDKLVNQKISIYIGKRSVQEKRHGVLAWGTGERTTPRQFQSIIHFAIMAIISPSN